MQVNYPGDEQWKQEENLRSNAMEMENKKGVPRID